MNFEHFVLIVEDMRFIREYNKSFLESKQIKCFTAENGQEAILVLESNYEKIKVILVDREMPIMGGMEFVKEVKQRPHLKDIPVIFVTSISESEMIKDGLSLGVFDYLIKPVDPDVLYLKVRNALKFYLRKLEVEDLNQQISEKNKNLEKIVEQRTREVREITNALLNALETANLYNDEDTGKHIQRVAEYSAIIAKEINLSEEMINMFRMYAPLHDIGKVGIPDKILKKPGRLTDEEFAEMKQHVIIGYNLIGTTPLHQVAKNIIKYHHEKWDGTGYPEGLAGNDIPLEARIVAIGDVFDALTTARSYKEAFSYEKSLSIMVDGRGKHFDPILLDAFLNKFKEILIVKNSLKDV